MKLKTALVLASCLSVSLPLWSPAAAQAPAAAPRPPQGPPVCKPAEQEVGAGTAPGAPVRPLPPQAPRDLAIKAIPGVVAAGGAWKKVWQQGGNSADGTTPTTDGGLLFAQEDYDAVLKLDKDGKLTTAIAGIGGVSSLSYDRGGHLWALSRTERVGSTKANKDKIVNAIMELTPKHATVADKWTDGTALTVRPNDLYADGHGGAYFTIGCLYYASPKGVSVVAENLRTNGVVFSPDDKTIYVTNGRGVVAFDLGAPGMITNRRDFAQLPEGANGDGMAVDSEGRLYVTSGPGVQVFDKTGAYLGVIPTPRGVISVAFSGPDKKTLYVIGSGADDDQGQPIRQGPQLTAATIYTLPVLAQGPKDRAK